VRRTLALLFLTAIGLAAPITGLFIGGQPRTLNVGREPFCLHFDYPVAGAEIESPAFAVELAAQTVCFRALDHGTAEARVILGGDRQLKYTLVADPTMPAVEIRVILPEPAVQAPSTKASKPDHPTEGRTTPPVPTPAPERPKHTVVPVEKATQPAPPPYPRTAARAQEEASLTELLKALEDVLVEIQTEPKPGPSKAEAKAPKVKADQPAAEPAKTPVKTSQRQASSDTSALSGYAAAKPRAKEDPTVVFRANLFPGKKAYRISYTLANKGKYPLITDPKRFELLYNGKAVHFEITQRASSGFVGWVPPGYEEAGTLTFAPLTGEGLLELRVNLLKLNPTRDSITVRRAWRLASLPVVVPKSQEGEE